MYEVVQPMEGAVKIEDFLHSNPTLALPMVIEEGYAEVDEDVEGEGEDIEEEDEDDEEYVEGEDAEEMDDDEEASQPSKGPEKSDRLFCDLCDKSYANKDKLRTHKRTAHKIHPLACLTCYLRFKTRKELNSHIQSTHNVKISERISNFQRPFNCNYCSMSFVYENKLQKHLLVHPEASSSSSSQAGASVEDKQEYPCNVCERKFTRSTIRDQHMTKSHRNAFQCHSCAPMRTFSSRAQIQQHEEQEHTFKCETCNKTLRSEESYKVHLRGHQHEVHTCRYCDQTFDSKEQLLLHRQHVHQKPQRCPVCHEMFEKLTLNDHVAAVHEKLICFTCHVEFPTLKGLKLHEIVHKDGQSADGDIAGEVPEMVVMVTKAKKEYQCDKCDASFKTEKKLSGHVADKHDEGGYKCDQCGKVFVSKGKLRQHSYKHNMKLCGICGISISTSLSTHMMRHANDKPFKCLVEGCGKTFPRNSDLSEHTKVHTGDKPFSCDVCGMRFTRRNKVTVHMRTHTGEKPYKCTFPDCQRQFAQSFDLTLHIRRHTGEKPYECGICGERFILTSLMKSHQVNCVAPPAPVVFAEVKCKLERE